MLNRRTILTQGPLALLCGGAVKADLASPQKDRPHPEDLQPGQVWLMYDIYGEEQCLFIVQCTFQEERNVVYGVSIWRNRDKSEVAVINSRRLQSEFGGSNTYLGMIHELLPL